ncbi:glutamine amidotransferase-related protein [Ferrimonas gelatinilytica]|uniref:Glutamine amidotransferase n=1 Tax=Ferrimonas gelatinilytica TaxID=1255257 RepID=A0ABP9SBG6_9GAMM
MSETRAQIGIVDCDRIDPALAALHGQYSDMFIRALGAQQAGLRFAVYQGMSEPLPEPTQHRAWLITGSRHSAFDPLPWIDNLKAWIRQASRQPVQLAGICFGHQVIAEALGGRVTRSPAGWGMGLYRTQRIGDAPWLDRSPTLALLASHQDQVQQLPSGARLLYRCDFCPYYSFALENRIFTVQGHPEFTIDYNLALAQKRRQRLGEDVYQRALRSFEQQPDSERFLAGLLRFLLREPH